MTKVYVQSKKDNTKWVKRYVVQFKNTEKYGNYWLHEGTLFYQTRQDATEKLKRILKSKPHYPGKTYYRVQPVELEKGFVSLFYTMPSFRRGKR